MALYPMVMSNSTKLSGIAVTVNENTDGILGAMLMISFSIVLFIALKRFSTAKALVVSSFISTIVGVLLNKAGVVADSIVWFFIIVTALATLAIYLEGQTT